MVRWLSWLALLSWWRSSQGAAAPAIPDDALTCGSTIKLKHKETNHWLHSHTINWGTGSGQQSVTAHGGGDDQGSLWVLREGNGNNACEVGQPIKCGSAVRLTHLQTNKNLHTHLFQSPLSKQQEVSCFGENGRGDTGDDWIVQCSKGEYWQRATEIRLKHKDTSKFLHSHSGHRFNQHNCPNCPINGQFEVTAFQTANTQNTWVADQGIFFKPPSAEGTCADD